MGTLEPSDDTVSAPDSTPKTWRSWRAPAFALLVLIAFAAIPLLMYQRGELHRARSMSNLRRLATGLLLYAQDWDGCAMPPATRLPDGRWQTWPQTLDAYVSSAPVFDNAANPMGSLALKHPHNGYRVLSGYAVNRRLWGVFSPGPFPLDNLEIAERTALFVEAGPMWRDPYHASETAPLALLEYGDMLDRVGGFCPYPSSHNGQMAVVAADGHVVMIKVRHYTPENGPHDPLYGRLGGNIYNWNGGFANGQTDRPPRE